MKIDIEQDKQKIRNFLNQPFSYLAKSSRCKVYISEDQQYVLKTFKSPSEINQQFKKFGIDLGRVDWSPSPGSAYKSAKLMYNETQKSSKLAFNELKQETGLIYLHLNKTKYLQLRILIDQREVELDNLRFVLQYKVALLGEVLITHLHKNEMVKVKVLLNDLVIFIQNLWSKGVTEDTFNFHDNYGVLNSKIVQIDIGELHKDQAMIELEKQAQKLLKKESFQWFKEQSPMLSKYLTKIAETILYK